MLKSKTMLVEQSNPASQVPANAGGSPKGEAQLPLPVHLSGRKVFSRANFDDHKTTFFIQGHPDNNTPNDEMRTRILDDLWHELSPQRQHAILMMSITPVDKTLAAHDTLLEDVRLELVLFADGDIRMTI